MFFCGGFNSNMQGLKALALEEYCQRNKQSYTRFDYSGHGSSEGRFEEGVRSEKEKDARLGDCE